MLGSKNFRIFDWFAGGGNTAKEQAAATAETLDNGYQTFKSAEEKVPSMMLATPEFSPNDLEEVKKAMRPMRQQQSKSTIGKIYEVDLNYEPTAEAPYPPVVMDFINRHIKDPEKADLRELKLSDLHFWHGLPHMIDQWVAKNPRNTLSCWFCPKTGELDCFVTTPALDILYGTRNQHGTLVRREDHWTEMRFDEDMLKTMSKSDVQHLAQFGHYINGQVWKDFTVPQAPAPGQKPNHGVKIRDDLPVKIIYDANELGPDGRLDSLWISDIDPKNLGPEHQWFVAGTPFDHMMKKKQTPGEFLDDPEAIEKWGPLMCKPREPKMPTTPANWSPEEREKKQIEDLKKLGFNLEPGENYLKPPKDLEDELRWPEFKSWYRPEGSLSTRQELARMTPSTINETPAGLPQMMTKKEQDDDDSISTAEAISGTLLQPSNTLERQQHRPPVPPVQAPRRIQVGGSLQSIDEAKSRSSMSNSVRSSYEQFPLKASASFEAAREVWIKESNLDYSIRSRPTPLSSPKTRSLINIVS